MLPPRDEAFIRGATSTFRLRLCPHGMQPPPEFGQIQQKDLDYWWLGEGLTELGDIMKIEVGRGAQTKYFLHGAPKNHAHYGLSIFCMNKH